MYGRGAHARGVKSEEQINFEFGGSPGWDDAPSWPSALAVILIFGSSAIFWLALLLYVF